MTDKELFFSMLYHDDKNSNYIIQSFRKTKKGKFCRVAKAKELPYVKIPMKNIYISINGFCGLSRKTEECRQINAIFFDLDCHCKNTKEVDWGIEHTYLALKDAIEEKRLHKPNLIINTGRGLHLYYIFEKSIPYRLTDKSVNEKGLKIRESIIKSISNYIQDVLEGEKCILKIDTKVSDISRIARIPGTKNTSARKITKILDYDEDYYTFKELLDPPNKKSSSENEPSSKNEPSSENEPSSKNESSSENKPASENKTAPENKSSPENKPSPKKKTKNNEFGQALHTIRLAELEKLQEYRNFDCRGSREYMCFVYYNTAVQVYDKEIAYNKLVAFRNKFDDARAVPNSQLKALAGCIDRNKGSGYEGFYKLKKDWIIQNLAITSEEIAELGLFKLSKQELKKQQNKIDKQAQAMQVVELAANGMKHQTIADTVGISKRKVQYILKAAGVTREYIRKIT